MVRSGQWVRGRCQVRVASGHGAARACSARSSVYVGAPRSRFGGVLVSFWGIFGSQVVGSSVQMHVARSVVDELVYAGVHLGGFWRIWGVQFGRSVNLAILLTDGAHFCGGPLPPHPDSESRPRRRTVKFLGVGEGSPHPSREQGGCDGRVAKRAGGLRFSPLFVD